MSIEGARDLDSRTQAALDELQETIQRRYPTARFEVVSGEDDPGSIQLVSTVDIADTDEVVDLVIDRLLELQIEEGLPVHVIPVRPMERVAEMMRVRGATRPFSHGHALLPEDEEPPEPPSRG